MIFYSLACLLLKFESAGELLASDKLSTMLSLNALGVDFKTL